ncbi:MAG: hypothetical protein IPH13_16530 [Planctomycetes bacterium]|nr:hypothetical protein [Planctomycetota bacterium]MCC7173226.1 hypothetical protein [Planctomycetota bacterium]
MRPFTLVVLLGLALGVGIGGLSPFATAQDSKSKSSKGRSAELSESVAADSELKLRDYRASEEARAKALDERLDALAKSLERLDKRLDSIDRRLDALTARAK